MSTEVQALKAQIDSTLQAIQDAVDEINAEVSQLASNVGDTQIVTDSTSRLKTLTDTLTQTVAAAKNNPAPTPPGPVPTPEPTPVPEPTPTPEPAPVDPNAPTA